MRPLDAMCAATWLQIETIHQLHVIENLCYDFCPFYTFQSPVGVYAAIIAD